LADISIGPSAVSTEQSTANRSLIGCRMLQRLDRICRDNLGTGPWPALAFVAVLGIGGAGIGLVFPKWTADGLLETPGVYTPTLEPRDRPNEAEAAVKLQYVTLPEFRKVTAAYSSVTSLRDFLAAAKKNGPAADRLLAKAEKDSFWAAVAAPILPFSRRDAKEFGELKDAGSNSLVGLDLSTDARTPAVATEMLATMGAYYANALIRERIRGWVLKNSGEAPAKQKALRAEVIEAQMKIEAMGRRIQDLKAILARYPDSAKLDARQVVSITEGSDRFLSPLVQLVAAESSIAQQRETIARKERQARQFDLIERYFREADQQLQSTQLVSELIPALAALASKRFEGVDPDAEWAREVIYRIQADIASFSSASASFGIRNESRVSEVPSRDPLRLAALAAGAGVLLLGLIAFVRASLRTARPDDGEVDL
jgi:hypothetical protein